MLITDIFCGSSVACAPLTETVSMNLHAATSGWTNTPWSHIIPREQP